MLTRTKVILAAAPHRPVLCSAASGGLASSISRYRFQLAQTVRDTPRREMSGVRQRATIASE